ncbi:hypothetical protein GGI15_004430 [Coemansia interrupta]|uniref:Uncharacterized protein n=1 Tax=Coemansia interrupta TaxID=1126814 RepID=A0A9W8HAH9_9FUNG|nr:hypothetical protein GGI15_004430 [Coemansia interrupta]
MPLSAAESVGMGIASLVLDKAVVLSDSAYLVMEALLSVVPADRPVSTSGWLKRWSSVMQKMAPVNPDSRKLCSLMLLLVNKFGAHLDTPDLDQISSAAGLLTVPQKKAVVLAAARKAEKKNK